MHRFQRWREVLEAAHSEAAVDKAMRDYAATLAPVMAVIPDDCRKAIEGGDLQEAAVTLLHCELAYRGTPEVAQLLHEIAHTYAAASLRLTRIRAEPLRP